MKTSFQTTSANLRSQYGNNTLLHLILGLSVTYIILQTLKVIFIVFSSEPKLVFTNLMLPEIALQPFHAFIKKPWIILSYALSENSFFRLLSNSLWLYCFGSIIQTLVGKRNIIPLFFYACVVGALAYLAFTAAFPNITGSAYIIGFMPAIMAFAVGAITLAPKFRFYLGDRLSIPLWVMIAIYLFLNYISLIGNNWSVLFLASASGAIGFLYIKLLQNGQQPGAWLNNLIGYINGSATPNKERKNSHLKILEKKKPSHTDQAYIDMLLDKINAKGYNALTQEEKQILTKASQSNDK